MIYLASPYSHRDPNIQALRYEQAAAVAAKASRLDYIIFSPIVYGHQLALNHSLPTDAAWWQEFNETILGACTEMWVLRLPGWEESEGVTAEIAFATEAGIAIQYIDMDTFLQL